MSEVTRSNNISLLFIVTDVSTKKVLKTIVKRISAIMFLISRALTRGKQGWGWRWDELGDWD